jgi:hypothetical protein
VFFGKTAAFTPVEAHVCGHYKRKTAGPRMSNFDILEEFSYKNRFFFDIEAFPHIFEEDFMGTDW